jgi:hypothetical protein
VEIEDKFYQKMVHKRQPLGISTQIQKYKKEEKILQEIMSKTRKRSKQKPKKKN